MVAPESLLPESMYRLLGDVLVTVSPTEKELRVRLLVAMASDAMRLGDRRLARKHLDDAIRVLGRPEGIFVGQ